MTDELLATAYHEAGHAIAGLLCGFTLVSVSIGHQEPSIEMPYATEGRTVFDENKPPPLPTEGRPLCVLLNPIAGPICEKRFTGKALNSNECKLDMDQAVALAMGLTGGSAVLAEAALNEVLDVCTAVFERIWPVVTAVAEHLFKRRTLNSAEVLRLIDVTLAQSRQF